MAIQHLNGYMEGMRLDEPVDAQFDGAGYLLMMAPEVAPGVSWFARGLFDTFPELFYLVRYDTYQQLLDEQFVELKETTDENGIVNQQHIPLKKLDVEIMNTKPTSGLANMYIAEDVVTKTGSLADKVYWETVHATSIFHHTQYTVGSGEDFASITSFISGGAESDCGLLMDASYTENVNFGVKTLELKGSIANQGCVIHYSSATPILYVVSGFGSLVQNLTVDADGNSKTCMQIAADSTVAECRATNGNLGIYLAAAGAKANNCLADLQATAGFYSAIVSAQFFTCLAGNNENGFKGSAANRGAWFGCVSFGSNTADFSNGHADYQTWNTSEDGTAAGGGKSIDTLQSSDYDASYHLKTTVAATTAVRREGYAPNGISIDGARQVRKHVVDGSTNYWFGGWSDADPVIPGAPSAPTWNGALVPGVTQVTLPVTASSGSDTLRAYYRLRDSDDAFTAGVGRTGSGDIVQTSLTAGAYYEFVVHAYSGTSYSLPTPPRVSSPYGAGDMDKVLLRKSPVWASVLTRVDNPGWT